MSNRLNFRLASLTGRTREKLVKKDHPGVIANLKDWQQNLLYNLCSRTLSKTMGQ